MCALHAIYMDEGHRGQPSPYTTWEPKIKLMVCQPCCKLPYSHR